LPTDRRVRAVRTEFARRDLWVTGPGAIRAPAVRHHPHLSRYEITVFGGVLAGVALYQRHERRLAFLRTEIEPRDEGAGLAGRLARAALDDVRELGLEVVPLCPVIGAFIRSHADEYLDLVVPAMREPLVEDGRPI
jgi:predicted GNAT family acetyltransferase